MFAKWKLCRKPTRWRRRTTGPGHRWGHLRRDRRERIGGISQADSGRTGPANVSAHGGTEERDTEDGGTKVRVLSIPAIRDRVVQGALKLTLEPIFEADFQPGSYGYRPKRTAHEAIHRVAQAIVEEKTKIIDLDLRAYFDNVQHSLLLEKVAKRVRDDEVMRLLKMILKATGKKWRNSETSSVGIRVNL